MKVRGLERLERQIRALPELQARAAAQTLQQNAEELAAATARAAPKRTGDMASKIKAAPATEAKDGSASIKGAAGLSWKITAPVPALWVERGTKGAPAGTFKDSKGKTRTNKRAHHATKAQPFWEPTIHAFFKRGRSRLSRNANKAAKAAAGVT
jgi:hypothetical protein